MSDLTKFENSEQQNFIAYNADDFTHVNNITSSTVDRLNCTATNYSEEPTHKNTDFFPVPAPHNESNIMNTVEEQCIALVHCAETCNAEKETNLIQDMMGTAGKTKDEMKILTNDNNMIVTQVSESSVDDDDNIETVIKDDTSISTDDNNMTVSHVFADSETDKNISVETEFCEKTEGEKRNKLPPVNFDEWCKHLNLLCLTQLLVWVFMEAFRNLVVIKIDLQKVVFNYFQKLKDKTSCFISEKIHQVINGAKLVGSIVTFAVREYITCYDEPIIRLILNDEENKKVYLVREYFRLATFGYYSRSHISKPVVLKLAREGYFCDPDGTIRCYKCYCELPLSAIHTFGVHIRCRFSYRHENLSIANSYGHLAPDWILDVNQQNQNDSDIRDLQSFDDVVLNRPRFTQQGRRQPLHIQENVFSLEMERRRRRSYSGRTIDLRAFRERSHARQDSYSSTETISIQPRGSVSPADDPMNEMLINYERNNTSYLLNFQEDSSITCHMNTAVTSACSGNNQGQHLPAIVREIEEQVISNISENIQSSDLLANQADEHTLYQIPNEPAAPVVVDSLLSDETHVKQIYESVRSRNPSDTIVTDIQSRNQEQPANRINSTHQTSPLTDDSCNVQEESEPPIAVDFRGSHTNEIDTGNVQPEELQKPKCKDSVIPAPDIPTLSMNSEHGENNQPANVDLALQTSPGPQQTSTMAVCDTSVSVQGPHTGNSLQPTVTGSFKSIRKRHSSQPTSDESKTEARRNMLPRKVNRTRHYSEPTVPSSTVAQAFYESLDVPFTPRSEQRKFSLASDQENKPLSHLNHSDESASAKVPNTASCVESLVQASLQIEETDVSETEQNQDAIAAAQSITDIKSRDGAARAINEHQKRRRRKTEKNKK